MKVHPFLTCAVATAMTDSTRVTEPSVGPATSDVSNVQPFTMQPHNILLQCIQYIGHGLASILLLTCHEKAQELVEKQSILHELAMLHGVYSLVLE